MSKQTMTIEELIKAGKMESSVEFPLKRYVVANEFDTKPNRVTYIHIVATAQTDKELKAMGY